MVKRIAVLLLLGAFPVWVMAQDKMETDRPTESQSAQLVGKGAFQAEIGFRKDRENKSDYSLNHPNTLLRYGVVDKFELRLRTVAESQRFYSKNQMNYGLRPIELGFKANLAQSQDTSFVASLLGMVGVPRLAAKDHRHSETFYRLRLLLQHDLSDKVKVTYNLGRDWNNEERQQNWMYAIAPQFELSDKWQVVLESYGFVQRNDEPEHYVDAGLAYYISNNFKVDINVGKGLSSAADDYFITTGFSFRLK